MVKLAAKIFILAAIFITVVSINDAHCGSFKANNSPLLSFSGTILDDFALFSNDIIPLSNIKAYKRWNEEDISWKAWFHRGYIPVLAFLLSSLGIIALLTFDVFRLKKMVNKNFQELWEAEENYYRLLEIVNDAVIIIDPKSGKILEVNQSAEVISGYLRVDLLEMSIYSLTLTSDNKANKRLFNNIEEESYIRNVRFDILTKEKRVRNLLLKGRLVKGYNKTIILLALTEIQSDS